LLDELSKVCRLGNQIKLLNIIQQIPEDDVQNFVNN